MEIETEREYCAYCRTTLPCHNNCQKIMDEQTTKMDKCYRCNTAVQKLFTFQPSRFHNECEFCQACMLGMATERENTIEFHEKSITALEWEISEIWEVIKG